MAFSTGLLNDPQGSGAGERWFGPPVIVTETTFEASLKIGRFAKIDTGSLDNMDGSATPVIAGVVLRNIANAIEDGAVIDASVSQVEYLRCGVVSVAVKSGETPTRLGRVYVSNAGDASDGMATATATDVAVNAEFLEELSTGVWLIHLAPPPGDIADHIGDAVGAHAATAISTVPAGTLAATTVQASLAELDGDVVALSPFIPAAAAIADPGDAEAIPVTRAGCCALTSGSGAETRTLADPAKAGLMLALDHSVDGGGAITVTAASAVNQTGNNTIALQDAGDTIVFYSIKIGSAYKWRVVVNDGCTLSTVS